MLQNNSQLLYDNLILFIFIMYFQIKSLNNNLIFFILLRIIFQDLFFFV